MMTSFQQQRLLLGSSANMPTPSQTVNASPVPPPGLTPILPVLPQPNMPPNVMLPPGIPPLRLPSEPLPPIPQMPVAPLPLPSEASPIAPLIAEPASVDPEPEAEMELEQECMESEPPAPGTEEPPEVPLDPANVPERDQPGNLVDSGIAVTDVTVALRYTMLLDATICEIFGF